MAELTLAVLGILTLGGAIYSWREGRQTTNLRVARRARRVHRVVHEWLNDASFDLTDPSRLRLWRERVARGEDEVQTLLEEMLDLVGGASPRVQRATRAAYRSFLHGADLINKFGQPELTGHATPADQAATAVMHFEAVYRQALVIVPRDLL